MMINTFVAHAKDNELHNDALYDYYTLAAKDYWVTIKGYLANRTVLKFSAFHALKANKGTLIDLIDHFNGNIHKYDDQFDHLIANTGVQLTLTHQFLNVFMFLARIASLDISVDDDKPFLATHIIIDYIQKYKNVYLLVNGTGEFDVRDYMYAYANDVHLIGVPVCASVADNVILSPVAFVGHDLIHLKRQESFGVHSHFKPIIVDLYNQIMLSEQRDYLVTVLWIVMHEATANNDKLLDLLTGGDHDYNVVFHDALAEYISNVDLHTMISVYKDLFCSLYSQYSFDTANKVFSKCNKHMSASMTAHLEKTGRSIAVDLPTFYSFVIGFVCGLLYIRDTCTFQN